MSAAHLSSSVRASRSACFSGFVKGQPAESELISVSSGSLFDSGPVGLHGAALEIGLERRNEAEARGIIEGGLAVEVAAEGLPVGADDTVRPVMLDLFADAETRDAGEGDEVTPVLGLLEAGDAAGAPDLERLGLSVSEGLAGITMPAGWIMPINRWPTRAASTMDR